MMETSYEYEIEELVYDGEENEEELDYGGRESQVLALEEDISVEEKAKSRCQQRKRRKCVPGELVWKLELKEEAENAEDQENSEEEDEDEEEVEEEEKEEEEEIEELISEYDSILSIVPFEWENEHYEFIDICDPGTMDDIYDKEEVEITYDIFGKMLYLQECNELKIPPIIRFYNALATDEADLTFHGITKKQMKAICAALETNRFVESLILKGNPLSSVCCNTLAVLLSKNSTITYLDLSGCRIGPEGAALLARGLKNNEAVKELNLSKCYIEDEGMKHLLHPLKENYFIEKLMLSYNGLGAEAGEALGAILLSNNCIRYLDLDNNNMFDYASMRKFCRGLGFNTAVTTISLKWNAMSSVDIANSISQFLRRNKSVKYLDLSDNRLDGQCVRTLKKGIARSKSIEILRLARNPVVSEDVEYLLSAVKNCSSLKLIDLQDIWVRKEFMKAGHCPIVILKISCRLRLSWLTVIKNSQSMKKIQAGREVEVIVGGVYSDYTIRGPDYAALMLKRAQFEAMKPKKSSAKRDLGHFMFMLGDEPLTADQFMTLMSKFKAKISAELLSELIKQFTVPKVNTINVVAMRKKYLSLFPDSKPPEQKKQQKDGEDERKTITAEPDTREGLNVEDEGNPDKAEVQHG